MESNKLITTDLFLLTLLLRSQLKNNLLLCPAQYYGLSNFVISSSLVFTTRNDSAASMHMGRMGSSNWANVIITPEDDENGVDPEIFL